MGCTCWFVPEVLVAELVVASVALGSGHWSVGFSVSGRVCGIL